MCAGEKKNQMVERKMKLILENWNKFINEAEETGAQKNIFVLVGPPSTGKSHWKDEAFAGKEEPYVINRDDIATDVASSMGWTYDDMFVPPEEEAQEGDTDEKYGTVVKSPAYMTWQPLSYDKVVEANNKVHSIFTDRVAAARPSGKDIVVDMTNMNAGAREGALSAIEGAVAGAYRKIAVVFKFEGAEEIIKAVAAKRAAKAKERGESKTIPPEVFDRMFKAFQTVDPGEGFDEVVSVDNIEGLQQYLDEPEQQSMQAEPAPAQI